jgi:hypothetical protein
MNELAPMKEGSENEAPVELRPDLLAWVRRTMLKGSIARYEVKHLISGTGSSHVGTAEMSTGPSPEEVTREIQSYLYDDAEGLGGPQLYAVLCFRTGETRYFARRHVKLFSGNDEDSLDYQGVSEPSNPAGLLAQTQRHNEVLMRISVDAVTALRNFNTKDLDRYMQRTQRLEDQRDEVSQKLHQLAMAENDHSLKVIQAKREDRQHELMHGVIELAMPALLAKALPGGVGAPPRGGDLLQNFVLGISPLQMQKIIPHLNPAQLMGIQSLQEAYSKGKAPSFGDVIVQRFLDSLEPGQTEALDQILRPDQIEELVKITAMYWQEREKQNGADPKIGAASSALGEVH